MSVTRPALAEDSQSADERRRAARALLRHPLLRAEGGHTAEFLLVRRHREELELLFADGLGYRLLVEPRVARLFKAGLGHDPSRPLRRPAARGEGRALGPRSYALVCLTLAALTRCPAQLLVDELVAQVKSAVADADLNLDLDASAGRRALAAALLVLVELGVLAEREGDLAHWADAEPGAVTSLLDVRRERLRLLLSASLSGAQAPDDLLATAALPSAAGGARVAVRRRLVESPVLSSTDLTPEQAEWWGKNRHREAEWIRDRFGLVVELRAEGAIAIDPDDELSDVTFPGTGSQRHAALLVLEHLVRNVRDQARGAELGGRVQVPVSAGALADAVDRVRHDHARGLRKAYADPAVLTAEVVHLLTSVHLLTPSEDGYLLHAAAARYAPQTAYAESLF